MGYLLKTIEKSKRIFEVTIKYSVRSCMKQSTKQFRVSYSWAMMLKVLKLKNICLFYRKENLIKKIKQTIEAFQAFHDQKIFVWVVSSPRDSDEEPKEINERLWQWFLHSYPELHSFLFWVQDISRSVNTAMDMLNSFSCQTARKMLASGKIVGVYCEEF